MIVSTQKWLDHVVGLGKLVRFLPVISWSGGAILLGTAAAIAETGPTLMWSNISYILWGVLLLQGIAAHAFNDCEDWRSGTDQRSPGILSGGTGVIKYRLFSTTQLQLLGIVSIFLSICLAVLLAYRTGPLIILFLSIGVWSATAYTCPPLRLAYRPLLGEWLGAWPAMVACTTGTSFILTGSIPMLSWWSGIIHATFSIAWLMQHHIPDIGADLTAKPVKNTTVAYLCEHWGWPYVTIPGAFYFLLVIILGLYAMTLHSSFVVSIVSGIFGMILALTTDPRSVSNITRNQIGMMAVSCFHFCLLALSFVA